ncbi:hypothetical protein Tco_0548128 [Tanacetum coccineum]
MEDELTWIEIPEEFLIKSRNSPIDQIVSETYLDFTTRQLAMRGAPVTYNSVDEICKASTDTADVCCRGRLRCKGVTKQTVGVIPKGLALLVFLGEVDINKKTENQAKMTKLSMEWKRLCKKNAKVRVNTNESAVKPEPELKNTIGCNLNPSDGPGKPNSITMKTVKTKWALNQFQQPICVQLTKTVKNQGQSPKMPKSESIQKNQQSNQNRNPKTKWALNQFQQPIYVQLTKTVKTLKARS